MRHNIPNNINKLYTNVRKVAFIFDAILDINNQQQYFIYKERCNARMM